ncbi:MAG: hypothetical protein OEW05_11365 [Candidatus Aminicenantes bacterium]|nr:hypothetical protein [Candidatus Aminicenantes bacterium]
MVGRKSVLSLAFLLLCATGLVAQQEAADRETESSIPELEAFHEVIYPIWHTAYPSKDTKALRGFVEQVNALAQKVYAAELPGILRDKADKWKQGVAEFRQSVEAFQAAAKGTDDQALLSATEALHTKYETLVRTMAPLTKEVDEFHRLLYIIYHKYLPDKKWAAIKATGPELAGLAEPLSTATLPKRLEARSEKYKAAAAALYQAAKELAAECQGDDTAALEAAIQKVHTKYQELEKIFN